MSSEIADWISVYTPIIDRALKARLPHSRLKGAERLNEAVRYAALAGGKRTRPALALLAAELCGGTSAGTLPVACGIEFLHAASLIFDDLPCMDDAQFRRARPCVHTRFGEDMAVLAGLALMNQAYALFARVPALLAKATEEIGASGMIGGQAADVSGSRSRSRLEKTTALTRLTMIAGAMSATSDVGDVSALADFGGSVGEAYQICDDLADKLVTPDVDKTRGQDERHGRANFIDEMGVEQACTYASDLIERSCMRLRRRFGVCLQTRLLEEFARSITARAFDLVKRNAVHTIAGMPRARSVERKLLAFNSRP